MKKTLKKISIYILPLLSVISYVGTILITSPKPSLKQIIIIVVYCLTTTPSIVLGIIGYNKTEQLKQLKEQMKESKDMTVSYILEDFYNELTSFNHILGNDFFVSAFKVNIKKRVFREDIYTVKRIAYSESIPKALTKENFNSIIECFPKSSTGKAFLTDDVLKVDFKDKIELGSSLNGLNMGVKQFTLSNLSFRINVPIYENNTRSSGWIICITSLDKNKKASNIEDKERIAIKDTIIGLFFNNKKAIMEA